MAPDDVADLRRDIQHIMAELASIKTMIATEQARCPHREEIARAANNTRRLADLEACVDRIQAAMEPLAMMAEQREKIKKLEERVDELRLSVVRMVASGGLAGGGVASAVALVAAGVGKALGWW